MTHAITLLPRSNGDGFMGAVALPIKRVNEIHVVFLQPSSENKYCMVENSQGTYIYSTYQKSPIFCFAQLLMHILVKF